MIMGWVFDLQPNQMTLDEVLMSNCGTLAAEAVYWSVGSVGSQKDPPVKR